MTRPNVILQVYGVPELGEMQQRTVMCSVELLTQSYLGKDVIYTK